MSATQPRIAKRFTHHFDVVSSDIDELGHAGNVAWVRWVNDAATAHSRSVGLDLPAYLELGLLWVVRRHDIEYLAPALVGDAIDATTWIDDVHGATSTRKTEFHHAGRLLARASTTWALLRIDTGRPTRIPAELIRRYE
ncbi:MAG: thioesterase family protein [Polyangiaceae bacterium]